MISDMIKFMKFPFWPASERIAPQPEPQPESRPEQPRQKHLKDGIPPIMACIGTYQQFSEYPGAEEDAFEATYPQPVIPGVDNVDYYGNPENLTRQNFKNPQKKSYVISPIDNLDKLSKNF